ncbi:SCO7613 C-terminal domain-containing membrane protein [Nocardioides daphniae]|uniref:Uncharacterized protein n=1 Tax=Nocardioides daphniae TaxID=402297 RepID=A0A4P7UGH5_9ACTN|nr:hypothetical protein [Nocardioides daphniae]QCC78461.1 hypothetical protein E2C04_16930 [Nocardioides daphniae]GGD12222.1 hypothetical protein GCM10007231_08980 [Nocardioides daphniae]
MNDLPAPEQAARERAAQERPAPGSALPTTFACPECRSALPVGTPLCPTCGIRLTGPLARQLWEVEQRIGSLSAESRRLRALLLQPPSPAEVAQGRSEGVRPSSPAPLPQHPGHLAPTLPRKALSGQQVLLGIAAFLLLSGLSFFLLVVWSLIGLVGQALVMVVLTGLAAGGAALATRKRLPAAAETAAVIASGLVWLDLWAAHRLGLAGLDALPVEQYWTVAGLVGTGLLLGFDALVPRHDATGELRRIVVYRPVALVFAVAALWSAVVVADPDGLGASVAGLLVAVASVGLAWAAVRLDGRTGLVSPSSVVPLLSAVVGLLIHLLVAFAVGYEDGPAGDRYLAMVLLVLLPVALLVVQRLVPAVGDARLALRMVGLLGLLVALGVPVVDAPRGAVAAVAAVVGLVLLGLAVLGRDGTFGHRFGWGDLLSWTLRLALVLLSALLLALAEGGHASGLDLAALRGGAGPADWWLPVVPLVALALATTVTAVRRNDPSMAAFAHAAAVAGVLVALRDAEPVTSAVAALVAAVVAVAVAGGARWSALERGHWAMEPIALAAAAAYAVTAVTAGLDVDAFVLATVLVALGALLAAYAALPGRLEVAYVAIVLLGAGLWVQLVDRDVSTVEAYVLPVAALLAGLGALQWLRDRQAPTFLTMGPAIVIGLLPSLMAGIADDSPWRLTVVTLVAALLLVVGIARRWRAPLVLGALALGIVAFTQGGPLLAYVPNFVLLVGSGAVLLVVGVMWERSIALGRRTYALLAAMQ